MTNQHHPNHLHTAAALWSLHTARRQLQNHIAAEARALALDPADGLRSPQYGTRGGGRGGHSDPTAGALITATSGTDRWYRLADRTTTTLTWLAAKLGAPGTGDPLTRLNAALPELGPAGATNLGRWLAELDERIRRNLGINPDRQPLTGESCPVCDVRRLYRLPTGPDTWLLICGEACLCTGDACPCMMPVRVAGAAHIWEPGLPPTDPRTDSTRR